MNIPMFFEKRGNQRRKLTGLLPGRMTVAGAEASLDCKPVDISPDGLGIITKALLPAGTEILLSMKGEKIAFEISWGQPDFGKKDLFRYGLRIKDESRNVENIFVDSGCLK